jgi:L-ascorbate metabolism protein UlaG (beta-lactamase superfamily)
MSVDGGWKIMRLTYFGHSAFLIEGKEFTALIDPYFPKVKPELDELDYIFVTHGHDDHVGETIELASKFKATIITNPELVKYFASRNLKVHSMGIGGSYEFPFGKVKMINAVHSSSIVDNGDIVYAGQPCGFLIKSEDNKIYHAGDTGLTLDMKLLEEENIDVALLPIGGNYTMDIEDAVKAVNFIKPSLVIPMHYDTFPLIAVDEKKFVNSVKKYCNVKVLKVKETIVL